jgi:hypothetical protein
MTDVLVSLHGRDIGLDKDRYLTTRVGAKHPELHIGPSGSEVSVTPTVTAASSGTTIARSGTATLGATAGNNPVYHLQAPVAGSEKVILASGASTGQVISSTAAGASFVSTGGSTHITGTIGKGGALLLKGSSTGLWHVVSNLGCVFA